MRKRARVYYSGRVQGIGFRYTAREVACGYEVTGFVRNLPDGRVEMAAEGDEEEAVGQPYPAGGRQLDRTARRRQTVCDPVLRNGK